MDDFYNNDDADTAKNDVLTKIPLRFASMPEIIVYLIELIKMAVISELSKYEQLRLTKIAANEAKLKELELDKGFMNREADELKAQRKRKREEAKARKDAAPKIPPVVRKSSRAKKVVDYNAVKVSKRSKSLTRKQ